MEPLHAHLYAMDGRQAYLDRLQELSQDYQQAFPGSTAKEAAQRTYHDVLANYRSRYPGSSFPAYPVPHDRI